MDERIYALAITDTIGSAVIGQSYLSNNFKCTFYLRLKPLVINKEAPLQALYGELFL